MMTRVERGGALALTAIKEWNRDRCDGLSSGLSFNLLLAVTPFLAFVLLIAGKLFGEGWTKSHLVPVLIGWVGPHITAVVRLLLVEREHVEARSLLSLGVVGALALVVGASGYFVQLRDALQTIWDVRRDPPGFRVQMKRRLFGILIALVSALIALAGLTAAALVFASESAFSGPTRWTAGTLIAFLTFWALVTFWFKILPPVRLTWREIVPWAALIALFHLLGKWFVFGGGSGADSSSNVGVAVSLILVMFWFYYANGIFLYGAELMRISLQRSGRLAHSEPSGGPPRMRIAR